MKKILSNKAFTLIELLVVISIIGMLSSVILASLSSAREKGKLASVIQFATHNYRKLGAYSILDVNFNEDLDTDLVLDRSDNYIVNNSITYNYGNVQHDSNTPFSDNGKSRKTNSGSTIQFIPKVGSSVPMALSDTSGFTQSVWINFLSNAPTGSFNFMGSPGWRLRSSTDPITYTAALTSFNFNTNVINCYLGNTSGSGLPMVYGSFTNFDSNWHNIVCSYDSQTNKTYLYIDGKLINSGTVNTASFYPAAIYGSINFVSPSLSILEDNFQLFSGSLTATEVQHLYAQGLEKLKLARDVGNTK